MSQRLPPHNLDAERSALGSVLIKPAAADELISSLATDDFFLPAHREIYDATVAVKNRGRGLDVIMLADELKARGMLGRLEGGEAYLLTLANAVPTAENLRHYIGIVREHAAQRRLIASAMEMVSRLYGGADSVEVANEMRAAIAKVESMSSTRGPVRIGDGIDGVVDKIGERRSEPDRHVITTGIEAFDARFRVFYAARLVFIAARPGGGKSSLAKDIALHAATNGIPALIFSPEMTFAEVTERMLSTQGRVPGDAIAAGAIDDGQMNRILNAHRLLRELPLWIDDSTRRWDRLAAELRIWRAEQRRALTRLPDSDPRKDDDRAIAFVDYLQLVKGREKAENQNLRVAEISQDAKALAKELAMPIVMLSQLIRGVEREERKPRPSDLRDSGSLEQDADTIIFTDHKTPDGDDPYSSLIVGKNRGGQTGEVEVLFEREYTSFRDVRGRFDSPANWQDGPDA